ncbi:Hpt domain-containing protein [Oceanicaulis alexandrii]|uniref:Hpt domain-containing protein n=1 Tax=Oceanicaulis alexandrii TaxID=153233 RepID=UPI0023576392|nr:Hpt domain-containing protein [Oceanicaulis alexandrii]|tara:strand:- start:34 stop:348 length:315 start_codon:yes stop_codon:yes gene_type:complete
MSAPVLDRDHLEQYTAGDAALETELFGLLSDQIDACVSLMKTARSDEDWRTAVHTLKGAARGVGAMELGEACAKAEACYPDAEALQAVETASERARDAMAAVRG